MRKKGGRAVRHRAGEAMKRAGGAAVSDGGGAVVVTSTQCVAPWVRAAVWCVIVRGAARGRQRVEKRGGCGGHGRVPPASGRVSRARTFAAAATTSPVGPGARGPRVRGARCVGEPQTRRRHVGLTSIGRPGARRRRPARACPPSAQPRARDAYYTGFRLLQNAQDSAYATHATHLCRALLPVPCYP